MTLLVCYACGRTFDNKDEGLADFGIDGEVYQFCSVECFKL